MAGEINTEVLDDPASCRATSAWLDRVKNGVSQIGDAVHQQRSASESFWRGTAGDACRGSLRSQGDDADEAERQVENVGNALTIFAGAIDQVRSRINQARSVAQEGKLHVTPQAILPPGPGPGASPAPLPIGPVSPQVQAQHTAASQAHSAAVAEHAAKQRAFDEAKSTVDAARNQQRQAHETLDRAMHDPLAAIKTTKTYTTIVASAGLNAIKGSHDAAARLLDKADRWNDAAEIIQTRAASKPGTLGDYGNRAAQQGFDKADDAATRAARAHRLGGPVPENVRSIIAGDAADAVKGGSTLARVGRGALRGVPFVGAGFSLASGAGDVAMGKDPVHTAVDTGSELAGGAAGGAAGAAIGTAICPGVGTVVGGIVGGIAGSLGAREGADAVTGDD